MAVTILKTDSRAELKTQDDSPSPCFKTYITIILLVVLYGCET